MSIGLPRLTRRTLLRLTIVLLTFAAALLLIIISMPLWQSITPQEIDSFATQLRRLGAWAVAASLLLMVVQAVIAPLPSSLIAAANGIVFGIWWGALLSWVGGMAGALLTYILGRRLGAGAAARWGGNAAWERFARVGEEHGFWVVLMARLTPIISLDFIGYIAGAWRMPWRRYLLANAIGIAPGMLIYTVIGYDLLYAEDAMWRVGVAAVALIALLLVGRQFFARYSAAQPPDGAAGPT